MTAEEFALYFTPLTEREQELFDRLVVAAERTRQAEYGESEAQAETSGVQEELDEALIEVKDLKVKVARLGRKIEFLEDELLERACEDDSI